MPVLLASARSSAGSDACTTAASCPSLLIKDKSVNVFSLTATGRNRCFRAAGAVGRCLDIRHRRNNNKQEGRQGRDVDGQKHGDQLPARDATGFSEPRHMLNAGSALVVRGSARGRHKEDRNTEDEAGSALTVKPLRTCLASHPPTKRISRPAMFS